MAKLELIAIFVYSLQIAHAREQKVNPAKISYKAFVEVIISSDQASEPHVLHDEILPIVLPEAELYL